MSIIEAIINGLVQGLTEFIPVSSSGHLELLKEVFNFSGSFENDVLINIGTILACLVYFRARIASILKDVFVDKHFDIAYKLIISFLPAAVAGFLFVDFFKSDEIRSLNTIIFTLFTGGVIMILLDKLVTKKGSNEVSYKQALTIGLAQILAFIPGVSRSGSTIVAGRASGLSYHEAVEYSFILGIPIIGGAVFRVLITPEGTDFIQNDTTVFLIGNLVAFIAGMLAIHLMVTFTKKLGLKWFGWYRVVLAIILVLVKI